jgi:carboxyl-terminal processing protease
MNRSRLVFLVSSCLLVLPMVLALVLSADPARGRHSASASAGDQEEDTYDTYLKHLKVFSEVLKLIRDTYVDKVSTDVLMDGALEGVTDAMDPFSVYVPASAVQGYTHALAAGRGLSGLAILKERGATLVMSVDTGSPADKAGVKIGDLVAKLNDVSTRTMPLWKVQEALAGEAGTKVSLEVIRLGAPVVLSFQLQPFTPAAVSAAERDENGAPVTAGAAAVKHATVLRIPSFGDGTAGKVREILAEHAKGGAGTDAKLVVDLRGVSTGEPEAAYEVAKLFSTGEMGSLMRRKSEVRSFVAPAAPVWKGRMVVLVDRGTGGPAEVFAAVVRQRAGADLVGEHTIGYAGHRAVADLSTGSRLFFTDAFYTGPDKKPINESLKPDVAVTERNRTFLEKDIPMGDLILRRGVHHLLEDQPAAPAKKAA